jgi:hypothetical protein
MVVASPNGIVMCQNSGSRIHYSEKTATVTKPIMIGVDLAKNVFQFHAVNVAGEV